MRASLYGARRPFPPSWLRLALLGLILLAFAVRLQELTRQDIWWDEARNIDVALRPFWQIPTAPELDIQPPVYYWLLHAWNGLFGVAPGQPPAALALFSRLLSVFAGVAGVALLFPLARRVLPDTPTPNRRPAARTSLAGPLRGPVLPALGGALAVLAGAGSPFWLAESQEARMYTVGFAFAAAAAVVLLRHIAAQDQPWLPEARLRAGLPQLAAFVLLSTAAVLTHYNMVFVLVAWYAWWGIWSLLRPDRWRQLATAAGCGLAMTLFVLPIVPIALRQIPGYENPNITIVSASEYLRQNWQAYLGGYAFDPSLVWGNGSTWLWLVLAVAAAGVALAVYRTWRTPETGFPPESHLLHGSRFLTRRDALTALSFLFTWLLGGLALYYIAVLDRNAFNVRYASFITPALYALIGAGLAAYGWWSKLLPPAAAALLLVGLVPAQQADLYDTRFDREHIGEVAAWLRANTGPGDVIFVDQKYPFGFYWQPYTIAAGDDGTSPSGDAEPDDAVPARYLFVDINTIDQRLSAWAGHARRVFWLRWFESDTDPRHAVPFLLDKVGTFAGEQLFQGYTLQWWDMQPPTDFVLAPNPQPATYTFGPGLATVELALPTASLAPGDPLGVAIRWQRTDGAEGATGLPSGPLARPLKARVALYDAAGARLVQADERLLNDRHRAPSQWRPEDRPLNVYMLPLPPDLPPGTYTVGLLVYDADTLEPLTLLDTAGNPAGQEAVVGTLEVQNP